ncbi:MAG: (deoxy)nucleoside triphosphate pyrophosphohydrolase [Candidatus Omnitrophota bacterium]|jgi:mutator protein MutT
MAKITKEVVGALIEQDGKYLVAQRKFDDTFGGLWEFPGGCIEDGETKEEALRREIMEELGLEIEPSHLFLTLSDEIPTLKINVYLFESRIIKGEPKTLDCQDVRWVSFDELKELDLAPADKKALVWLEK